MDTVTDGADLLAVYKKNILWIQVSMGLVLFTIIFWIFLFPLTEEQTEGWGMGGALLCASYWFGMIIIYTAMYIWLLTKKSETAAMMGCFLGWAMPLIFIDLESSLVIILLASALPMVLTAFVIRMLWLDYQIGKVPPPRPTVDYPVAPPPNDRT
jgi:hypothetical protein